MCKSKLSIIGLLQALGVAGYCALIGIFFGLAKDYLPAPNGIVGTVLMLVILVSSAAATGAIVFGYSAYLALNDRIRDGLIVFAHTLTYCFIIIIIAIIIMVVI